MDEKSVEKKIIQDYIFKNTKNKLINLNRDRDSHKLKKSEPKVKMVEDSRQNHQRLLIKISPNTSIGKLNRISGSRTPKHLSFIESKAEAVQHKSLLKTPRMEQRNKTPQF